MNERGAAGKLKKPPEYAVIEWDNLATINKPSWSVRNPLTGEVRQFKTTQEINTWLKPYGYRAEPGVVGVMTRGDVELGLIEAGEGGVSGLSMLGLAGGAAGAGLTADALRRNR